MTPRPHHDDSTRTAWGDRFLADHAAPLSAGAAGEAMQAQVRAARVPEAAERVLRTIVVVGRRAWRMPAASPSAGMVTVTMGGRTLQGLHHRFFRAIHRGDGYAYQEAAPPPLA